MVLGPNNTHTHTHTHTRPSLSRLLKPASNGAVSLFSNLSFILLFFCAFAALPAFCKSDVGIDVDFEFGVGEPDKVPYLEWTNRTGNAEFIPTDYIMTNREQVELMCRCMFDEVIGTNRSVVVSAGTSYGYWWLYKNTNIVDRFNREVMILATNFVGNTVFDGSISGNMYFRWWNLDPERYPEMLDNQYNHLCIPNRTTYREQPSFYVYTTAAFIHQYVGRFYELRLKNYITGEILRDYFPMQRNGTNGLYDVITRRFCPKHKIDPRDSDCIYGLEDRTPHVSK